MLRKCPQADKITKRKRSGAQIALIATRQKCKRSRAHSQMNSAPKMGIFAIAIHWNLARE
jgi:hypothetical protein